MAVQQHILNWLYSVLTSEYHDVNRTYNDVAQALSAYPSLSPRTDVHTFDNGSSALLLHITGTIPVVFRGITYRFPISLWVPHAYPREAPFLYVTPTETMMVRPGQHVDPQGRVYHPYLVGWAGYWDKSSILDFLAILRDVFAKEPPVIARQPARQVAQQPSPSPGPPPVPPLPPDMTRQPASQIQSPQPDGRPPPPPPKNDGYRQSISASTNRNEGPPLPPLPPSYHPSDSQYGQAVSSQPPQSNRTSRYEAAPPLPAQLGQPPTSHVQPGTSSHGYPPPGDPTENYQHRPQGQPPYQQGPPQDPQQYSQDPRHSMVSPPSQYNGPPPQAGSSYASQALHWQQPQAQPPQQHQIPPQPVTKPPPPPDIMDEPLTLSIPSPQNVPAPPIPPNPEKDALLRQLGSTLHALRQRSRQQDETSLAGLNAQRTAMLSALSTLQSESAQLSQLSALLSSNTSVLQSSLQNADAVIENSKSQKPPAVDELLVAPTVVGNQLYDLVAEERALGDAIFVLGRAVERGRIAPTVFAKTTRSLAREWYLKKALVRKIGVGMGLAS